MDFVFAAETEHDLELGDAIWRAGNVVQPVLGLEDANREGPGEPRYPDYILPNTELRAASAALGHTNVIHDPDGYIRKAPTIIQINGEQFMSLGMAAIQVFLGVDEAQPWKLNDRTLEFAGRRIPVDEAGVMIIHYAGSPAVPDNKTYRMLNYRSVIEGPVEADLIKDKIVLVGVTATGGKDFFLTPVSNGRPMAGVEILANFVETIWSNRFISRPGTAIRILILLFLGALIGVLSRRVWSALAIAGLVAIVYFLLSSWLFDYSGMMLDLFYPFLVVLLSFITAILYRLTRSTQA